MHMDTCVCMYIYIYIHAHTPTHIIYIYIYIYMANPRMNYRPSYYVVKTVSNQLFQ